MIRNVLKRAGGERSKKAKSPAQTGTGAQRQYTEGGSGKWIPFASFCTTGQFMKLGKGYVQHCGPTAAVNLIRSLEKYADQSAGRFAGQNADRNVGQHTDRNATRNAGQYADRNTGQYPGHNAGKYADRLAGSGKSAVPGNRDRTDPENLFLMCAEIGRRTRIYWNTKILGRFGGTSNPLTGIYLRRCLRASGDASLKVRIRFHVRITPDAVEEALRSGAIVYLQVYGHPKYKNHHMLCYGFRYKGGRREFLLADGWSPGPAWVGDKEIGHGHYLTIHCN